MTDIYMTKQGEVKLETVNKPGWQYDGQVYVRKRG